MSTITRRSRAKAAARAALVTGALAAGWLVATAAILAATERAEAVVAVFPRELSAYRLPAGVAILSWDGRVGRFASRNSGYVLDLYRAGAIAVLPARKQGCLSASARTGDPRPSASRQSRGA